MTTRKPSAKLLSKAAAAMGRVGGSACTPKQNAARAQNSMLAGRPGRICITCGGLVQTSDLGRHDGCGLWTWRKPADRVREEVVADDVV